jgi:iron complex outermembrane receptor protein
MSGGAQYTLPFFSGTVTPRLDWNFQSTQTFNPSSSAPIDPTYTIKGYSIFNATGTYAPNDSKWTLIAAVTNLTNKFYYYQLFGGGAVNISSNVAPPREYTIRVRRDF